MDRVMYADNATARLRELRDARGKRAFPRPSNLDTSRRITENSRRNEQFLGRIEQLLARLEALRSGTQAGWEDEQHAIERELSELEEISISL